MSEEQKRLIKETFLSEEIEINDLQAEQFQTYYNRLIETNKVMNLTRITDFQEVLEKHFVDSLMISKYVDMKEVISVLDLGSGAGFPGIPLKIVYPHLHIMMVDSVGKKMRFVQEIASELNLENAEAVHGRAEDLARKKEYREQFDLCVSRAVANLSTLSEYCLPFVRVGGIFAAYKSSDCEDEINAASHAIRQLGGDLPDVNRFKLFGMGRAIVLTEKNKKTPNAYPRKAGTASRCPLP